MQEASLEMRLRMRTDWKCFPKFMNTLTRCDAAVEYDRRPIRHSRSTLYGHKSLWSQHNMAVDLSQRLQIRLLSSQSFRLKHYSRSYDVEDYRDSRLGILWILPRRTWDTFLRKAYNIRCSAKVLSSNCPADQAILGGFYLSERELIHPPMNSSACVIA